MRLLFADDAPHRERGSFRLIQLHGRWYVVARGVFYHVDGYAEGLRLVEQLKAGTADRDGPTQ